MTALLGRVVFVVDAYHLQGQMHAAGVGRISAAQSVKHISR